MSAHSGRLNGYKEPVIVVGSALVPIALFMLQIYGDMRELKAAQAQSISAERIAKLESQVEELRRCIINKETGCVPISTEALRRFGDVQRELDCIKTTARVCQK